MLVYNTRTLGLYAFWCFVLGGFICVSLQSALPIIDVIDCSEFDTGSVYMFCFSWFMISFHVFICLMIISVYVTSTPGRTSAMVVYGCLLFFTRTNIAHCPKLYMYIEWGFLNGMILVLLTIYQSIPRKLYVVDTV
jgi:hypothetical protein